ncbi:MAG TPA: hypothetical protein VJZ78_02955 [Anaerolineales bacterium]|nr:hypothetical protein [Anaerolineales bacterium]
MTVHLRAQDVLPVLVAVTVIITVAILEKYSKLFAAITATMPLTIPLAIWIVYSANNGDKLVMSTFTQNMIFGMIPTTFFVIAAWICSRAGLRLLPTIGIGYFVWGVSSWLLILIRRALGLV